MTTDPNAGTCTHDRLISAREAERLTKLSAPPPYRPGDLAWRCGFEHALRQAAALCDAQAEAFNALGGGNGPDIAIAVCKAAAREIRNMKPEAPK
jgi:hypothetical protein